MKCTPFRNRTGGGPFVAGIASAQTDRRQYSSTTSPGRTAAGVRITCPARGDRRRIHAKKFFADALDYYQAANAKQPSARLLTKIGMMNLHLMRVDASRKDFERAVKMDPNFADAHNNLGTVYYQNNQMKQAIKEYQKAIAINPAQATYHSNMGTAYLERKEFDKATSEYARAFQLDPDIFEHPPGHGHLSTLRPDSIARDSTT